MKPPTKLCPCCKNPLSCKHEDAGDFVIWCGVGRCPSEAADTGMYFDASENISPNDAADRLIAALLAEPDWE